MSLDEEVISIYTGVSSFIHGKVQAIAENLAEIYSTSIPQFWSMENGDSWKRRLKTRWAKNGEDRPYYLFDRYSWTFDKARSRSSSLRSNQERQLHFVAPN
jgi:hypothetical protein